MLNSYNEAIETRKFKTDDEIEASELDRSENKSLKEYFR